VPRLRPEFFIPSSVNRIMHAEIQVDSCNEALNARVDY
jgi:hypothetical protein